MILLRMIPWDQEFEELQARVLFNRNMLTLEWQPGQPLQPMLVAEMIKALDLPVSSTPGQIDQSLNPVSRSAFQVNSLDTLAAAGSVTAAELACRDEHQIVEMLADEKICGSDRIGGPARSKILKEWKAASRTPFTAFLRVHYLTPVTELLSAMERNAKNIDAVSIYLDAANDLIRELYVSHEEKTHAFVSASLKIAAQLCQPFLGEQFKAWDAQLEAERSRTGSQSEGTLALLRDGLFEDPLNRLHDWASRSMLQAGAETAFDRAWTKHDSSGTGTLKPADAHRFIEDLLNAIQELVIKELLPFIAQHAINMIRISLKHWSLWINDDRLYELCAKIKMIAKADRPPDDMTSSSAFAARFFPSAQAKELFQKEMHMVFKQCEEALLEVCNCLAMPR
eukprot:COSAG02_NODE_9447_length_2213_cov_2.165090_2_plen_396_part_00